MKVAYHEPAIWARAMAQHSLKVRTQMDYSKRLDNEGLHACGDIVSWKGLLISMKEE